MVRNMKPLKFIWILLLIFASMTPVNASTPDATFTSNRYTQPDRIDTDWTINQEIPASYALMGENETYALYATSETLAFKVVDKRSGYVWHSNFDNVTEEDKLNKTWTAFSRSAVSIDFLNDKANSDRAILSRDPNEIDFRKITEGYEATIRFTQPDISLTLRVTLGQDGVKVEVPFESIQENNEKYKFEKLHLFPFFGATRGSDVPGYMFVPDGSGALIRFTEESKALNMFYGRYYGTNLGMTSVLSYDSYVKRPYKISIPVTGMIHGYKQHGYLLVVENGASYGELQVHPAGIITQFNFLYNAFTYNEAYFQATNRSGAGVTVLQKETNEFDIAMEYRFLDAEASDYVGMARDYRSYLIDRGELKDSVEEDDEIGIHLEFLGAEKEKFLFWDRSLTMTTVQEMADILLDLTSKGVVETDVVYYGWQPKGASTITPETFKLEKKLGSTRDLLDLVAEIKANQGSFSLYLDPLAAIEGASGFNMRTDLAMSITNKNLYGYNRNKTNYYFNLSNVTARLTSMDNSLKSNAGIDLAVDSIADTVFTDFKNKNFLNRDQAIVAYRSIFEDMETQTGLYQPNDYMYRYAKTYYDIPLTNSGYIYMSDSVPFLSIVLNGSMPTYSTALNFASDAQADLLRLADYGVYPTYYLTKDATSKILNTTSNWIYSSSYEQWGKAIADNYAWLNAILGEVEGESIVSRDIPMNGVSIVTYSNQKQIIVNYTNASVIVDGQTIQARDAILSEVTR